MNSLRIVFFLIIVLIFTLKNLSAQWKQTNGPYGGDVYILTASPNGNGGTDLFAGTDEGGIFLSTDYGSNWKAINTGLSTNYPINAILVSPDSSRKIFVGSLDGAFLSKDHGNSWLKITNGLADNTVYAFAINGTNLFAGTDSGVFLTTNNGNNWMQVNNGLTNLRVTAIAVVPNETGGTNILAGTTNYSDFEQFGGIFLSSDNGNNWKKVGFTDGGIKTFACSPNSTGGTNIFVGITKVTNGVGSGKIFLSTNNGNSWTSVSAGMKISGVTALIQSSDETGGTVFIASGGSGGVFLSTDDCKSWKEINTGLTSLNVNTLAVCHNAIDGIKLFAGTQGGGVFLSTNNGTEWSMVNKGLKRMSINVLANMDSNLYAGTEFGIFRSTNHGDSWTTVNVGLKTFYIRTLAIGSNGTGGVNLLAGDDLHTVYHSIDDGKSWTAVTTNLQDIRISSLTVKDSNLFIGTDLRGILRSTNNGNTWSQANKGLTDSAYISIAICDSNIFAGTHYGGGIFRSTDNGDNWIAVNAGLKNKVIYSLFVSGTNLFAKTYGGIFRSTNNGDNWAEVGNGLANNYGRFCVNGTNLFAIIHDANEVFLSTNNGISWSSVNTGLTNIIYALAVNNTNLYAGTYKGGVWRRPLSEMITDVEENDEQKPSDFALAQNYPNPFNPTTVISYQLPVNSYVSLKVYDMLGREVATLVNENKDVGNYSVQWNAASVVSGTYIYRLQAGKYFEAKKLVVIK